MCEIEYISFSTRQADNFLREMADFMRNKGINFTVDRKNSSIATPQFRIICTPIFGGHIGRSRSKVKFVINDGYPTEKLSQTQFEKVNLIIDDIKSKFKSDVEYISIEQLKTLIENTAAEDN